MPLKAQYLLLVQMNKIDEFLQDAQDWCTAFVCPIFDSDTEYPLQGSSILFTHQSRYFMITAAHVLDPFNPHIEIQHSNLFVRTNQGQKLLANFVKGQICSTGHPSGNRDKDKYDFAYFELNDLGIELFSGYTFLTTDMLDLLSETEDTNRCLCFGWLAEDSNILPETKTLRLNSFAFLSYMIEDDKYYNFFKLNRRSHVFIKFNRYKATITTNNFTYAPHPRGMSGGAILSLAYDENTNTTDVKLKAIGIEYRRYYDVIIATKLSTIFDHMKEKLSIQA